LGQKEWGQKIQIKLKWNPPRGMFQNSRKYGNSEKVLGKKRKKKQKQRKGRKRWGKGGVGERTIFRLAKFPNEKAWERGGKMSPPTSVNHQKNVARSGLWPNREGLKKKCPRKTLYKKEKVRRGKKKATTVRWKNKKNKARDGWDFTNG